MDLLLFILIKNLVSDPIIDKFWDQSQLH